MANGRENIQGVENNQPPANIVPPLLLPQNSENPRTLGFFGIYRSIFCPRLHAVSFIFVISIIDIIIYIVSITHSLSTGGLDSSGDSFLAPNNSTLLLFGAKVFFRINYSIHII